MHKAITCVQHKITHTCHVTGSGHRLEAIITQCTKPYANTPLTNQGSIALFKSFIFLDSVQKTVKAKQRKRKKTKNGLYSFIFITY